MQAGQTYRTREAETGTRVCWKNLQELEKKLRQALGLLAKLTGAREYETVY